MTEAIGITKRFGSLTALDGLSTRVPEGALKLIYGDFSMFLGKYQ